MTIDRRSFAIQAGALGLTALTTPLAAAARRKVPALPAMLDVLVLGYCGGSHAAEPYLMLSQIGAFYYFAHFLIILPIVSSIERPDPLPFSITEAVLGHDGKAALGAAA